MPHLAIAWFISFYVLLMTLIIRAMLEGYPYLASALAVILAIHLLNQLDRDIARWIKSGLLFSFGIYDLALGAWGLALVAVVMLVWVWRDYIISF